MRVCRITISHFRGIKSATILLPKHAVLIGDNNTGKTTILEALDLVLGPDRLNRISPIDEYDFYQGEYLAMIPKEDTSHATGQVTDAKYNAVEANENGPKIEIEVTVTDLSEEQKSRFNDYIEFWKNDKDKFYEDPNPIGIDTDHISEALRVTFYGWYDPEEDDFLGKTYFTRSLHEGGTPVEFRKKDKQLCGFLYLRSLRTGRRALSLERGSLLDIILRLKEVRPHMWEDTIGKLEDFSVAENPEIGISGVLESINNALKKYVPKEWGVKPQLKVSNLTREHLRKVITAFIATGEGSHVAPFYRQGAGTINMLVLAMLSQIAADKQNVIFAMEEPETAIPPYAQKRIVYEIRSLSSQAIFTSHSPYVIEEFTTDETVVLSRNSAGELSRKSIELPENMKLKTYRQDFRTRFCEGLLSRRVLIAEGATETTAFPVVCRRLEEINPTKYKSLEVLGISILNATSDSKISGMTKLFHDLGKQTFALCDRQENKSEEVIKSNVDMLLMHDEHAIEDLVLNGTTEAALKRFASTLEWPQHLVREFPDRMESPRKALGKYFCWSKGNWGLADFLAQCTENEIPEWLRNACRKLMEFCDPPPEGEITPNHDEAEASVSAMAMAGAGDDGAN